MRLYSSTKILVGILPENDLGVNIICFDQNDLGVNALLIQLRLFKELSFSLCISTDSLSGKQ
jgi:hypothetical protein